jgi:nicotinic acid phosphoribosyltransferase
MDIQNRLIEIRNLQIEEAKGFASTNVVLGIGSFTYQYNTRDTFGFAMKATYVEVNGEGREIFKDPITDDGTKKSATGLLHVTKNENGYMLVDKVSSEDGALIGYRLDNGTEVFYEGMTFENQY